MLELDDIFDIDTELNDYQKFIVKCLLDESILNNSPSDGNFLLQYYHAQLIETIKLFNKIIFLPIERDKLHIILIFMRCFTHKNIRKIFYISSSIENLHEVVNFLRRHAYWNIFYADDGEISEKFLRKFNESQIYIFHFQHYSKVLQTFPTFVLDVDLIIFDNCVYGIDKYPMKQIVDAHTNSKNCPKIIGITSTLIHENVDVKQLYEYFKQMEFTYKSSIITSASCNIVKKYLTRIKYKYVKYVSPSQFNTFYCIKDIKNLIDDLYFTIEKLACYKNIKNTDVICRNLISMLNDITYLLKNYGLYATFIALTIFQIELEKMKLCCDQSLFMMLSAVITDFNMMKMLISKEISKTGYLHDPVSIITNSEEKIRKLVSLLCNKMNDQFTCVIFVKDEITAQVIAHLLQKVSTHEMMRHILADYLINYETSFKREHLFKDKCRRMVLKGFNNGIINVIILSYNSKIQSYFLTSDLIVYFDLPPNYLSYVISRKYANCTNNTNFFFIKKTDCEKENKRNIESLENFVSMDLVLKEVLQKKDVNSIECIKKTFQKICENAAKNKQKSPSFVSKTKKEVKLSAAIDLINKYCEYLPKDMFTHSAPQWSIIKKDDSVICRLRLPIQSAIKTPVEGTPVENVEISKHVIALETVKILYKSEQLDNNFLPMIDNIENELNDSELFPHWKFENEDTESGSSNCCRIFPINFPKWLNNCFPQPDVECYLHIIHVKPVYNIPSTSRKFYFHTLMASESEFGFLTSEKLPEICQFPIYIDLGRVDIQIQVNALTLKMTKTQIEKLISFHRFIFFDVLQVIKGFLICDNSNTENSYCVVPLCPDDDGILSIAWDVVNNLAVKEEILEPSEEERIHTDYSKDNYIGKVVTPWYRVLPQRYYIITDVLTECTPNSPFSSSEYESFSEYYTGKYLIEVKQPLQPLLEVRAISTHLNCIRPRAQNPGTRRKRGEKEPDFEETLVPEFCVLQSFPAVYWYKSITLVAITHRLHFILNAETIRQHIASQSQIISLPDDEVDVVIADKTCISEIEETVKPVIPVSLILKDVKLCKRNRSYPWGDEPLPTEIEKKIDSTCLLDILAYFDFMKISKKCVSYHTNQKQDTKLWVPLLKFIELNKGLSPGPKQRDILQALTIPQSGDIFNFERFKLIGNSFINFAVSFWLYKLYSSTLNICQLNRLKRNLIGKRNLFYCGSILQLGSFIKLQDLSTNNDWNFSGFSVPELLVNILKDSAIPPEVIFNLEIPRNEQISGLISSETRNCINEKMLNFYDEISNDDDNSSVKEILAQAENNNHALLYLRKQSVPDKAIVNVVKALSGVYLANCGIHSGMKFLQYIGILKQNVSLENLYSLNLNLNSNEDYFSGFDFICNTLNYKFKSTQLPLTALTHHSCFPETSSECNQKLSFLGDAVLDFLLTDYIYEYCQDFTIKDVEDLRISLVNDIFYAVLFVRLGLHKFLSVESPCLIEKIDEFVRKQENVNHEINSNEYLFLIEETSNYEAISIDVPKALSDGFKSVVAAIFLDCNCDLKTVWNVCYGIMKNEIEKFMYQIPKNPIRLLLDTNLQIEFKKLTPTNKNIYLTQILLHLSIDNSKKYYRGTGSTKGQAKIIAAKLALKDLYKKFIL